MAEQAHMPQFAFRTSELRSRDLLVVEVDGTEKLSQQFHYRLHLASKKGDIDTKQVVGKAAVLTVLMNAMQPGGGHPDDANVARYTNGIISRFEHLRDGTTFSEYEAELVPYVWIMNFRQKSRIYQQLTTPEILEKVLKEAGLTSKMYRLALQGQYKKRDYCVQYRETEWNFLARLMEEEGIFYFFEHQEENHTLVIGDNAQVHVPIVGDPLVPQRAPSGLVSLEHIIDFRFGQRIRPGSVTLRDFEFTKPVPALESKAKAKDNPELEIYDFPSEYVVNAGKDNKTADEGKRLSEIRLQEYQTTRLQGGGTTDCRRFIVGSKFTLIDSPRKDNNQDYLLTQMHMKGFQPGTMQEDFGSGHADQPPTLVNTFVCIPSAIPFRPTRTTRKPVVHGTQTAIVVGPSGEEIYTDEHGRVKVHFHWDREGKFGETDSCWVRVSQGWAGGQYGSIFLPRIGQEVIVDFLEGDPDQPIIVGRIYNGDHKPPYTLPDEKTKSTIRTSTSKGGGGANELRFEDKKGSEQIFLHAEKDLHIRTKANRVTNIGWESHETVEKEFRHWVKKDYSLQIDEKLAIKVAKSFGLTVGGDYAIAVGGDKHVKSKNFYQEATADAHVKAAANIVIEAGAMLTLKGPGGFIVIDGGGVTIVGTMVKINSGGSAGSATAPQGPASPAKPVDADVEKPGKDVSYTGTSEPPVTPTPPVLPDKTWIKISLIDKKTGEPVHGEFFRITSSDGEIIEGTLDVNGEAYVAGLQEGNCEITFPNRDKDEWNG